MCVFLETAHRFSTAPKVKIRHITTQAICLSPTRHNVTRHEASMVRVPPLDASNWGSPSLEQNRFAFRSSVICWQSTFRINMLASFPQPSSQTSIDKPKFCPLWSVSLFRTSHVYIKGSLRSLGNKIPRLLERDLFNAISNPCPTLGRQNSASSPEKSLRSLPFKKHAIPIIF